MRTVPQTLIVPSPITRPVQRGRSFKPSRRDAIRFVGGAGLLSLAGAGLGPLRRVAPAFAQEEMPAMEPPPVGPRPDGSTLWRVQVAQMTMGEPTEFHAFFPEEITVATGDAIWFDFGMMGFHTVTFLSGAETPPFLIPDPELPEPTANASAPPKLILRPDLVFPVGGETYDGTGYLNSGIDVFRDSTLPYVVTFTRPGTYDYLCQTHPAQMKARVIVQDGETTSAQTQATVDEVVADEMAKLRTRAEADLAATDEAISTKNADGTTTWEVNTGAGGESQVRVQAFLPKALEIKVGDTVTWVHRVPGEPHTISFVGKGESTPEDLLVEQFADGSPKFVQNMETLLAQGGNVWSGRGWVHSGFMGRPDLGEAMEHTLTFDTPGDFPYFCLFHGDAEGKGMSARITVSPR